GAGRTGHRPHGSAAREPREEAGQARRGSARQTRAEVGQQEIAVQSYGVGEVQKMLRLSRSTIRTLVRAGFVSPMRGPRNAWQFSFQDLIVLRTAQALAAAKVPTRRIARSMKELRRHLPEAMPLSGLSISAVADRVVVREGTSRWQAESGQYLLAFEGDPADGSLSVIAGKGVRAAPAPSGPDAD